MGGRTLDELVAERPADTRRWMTRPRRAPARRREPARVRGAGRPPGSTSRPAGRHGRRDHPRRRRQGGGRARARRAARGVLADRLRAAVADRAARPRRALDGDARQRAACERCAAPRSTRRSRRERRGARRRLGRGRAPRRPAPLASRRRLRAGRAGGRARRLCAEPRARRALRGRARGLAALAAELAPAPPSALRRAARRAGHRDLGGAGRPLARRARRAGSPAPGAGDLDGARAALPSLCGRDPDGLDAAGLCRATVESVAENTADAVVGALLWGAVAGPAGVAAYRAANTLDAMVGHRSERYARSAGPRRGSTTSLSWPGARAGRRAGGAVRAARRRLAAQTPARRCAATAPRIRARTPAASRPRSPARSGLRLGGPLAYGGRVEPRPSLGDGRPPRADDVERAIRLGTAVGVAAVLLAAGARELTRRRS